MVLGVMLMKNPFGGGGGGRAVYSLLDEEKHSFISVVVMAE